MSDSAMTSRIATSAPDDQQEVDLVVAQTLARRLQVAREVFAQVERHSRAATSVAVQFEDGQTQRDARRLKNRDEEIKYFIFEGLFREKA